jgi:hypothetical protein
MDQLTKYLISELIDGRKVTAVYGGEFKPPTKEHFNLVKKTLEDNKQIDKVIIYVGNKAQEGITQEQALQVWGLFKEMLGDKIEIIPSSQPLKDIETYIKNNPNDLNLKLSYDEGLDSIGARKALKSRNKEKFLEYLPEEMPDTEKESVWSIFEDVILKETPGKAAPYGSGYKKVNENTIPSINIIQKCAELTQHMIDKGYNIQPLPSVKFIGDDVENAGNFLGKTAYYNPEDRIIVVYTYGRHPKDIVRSFAHEMIHHMQNLEGRLEDITTTDTTEDDRLNDLEKEANLKGTMSFRNWTDGLQEDGQKTSIKNMDDYKRQNNPNGKVKDPFGLNQFARELAQGLEETK